MEYKIDRSIKYGEFLTLFPLMSDDLRNIWIDAIKSAERPVSLAGKPVPENLGMISYGMLDDIMSAHGADDPVTECAKALLGLSDEDVYHSPACDVFGLCNFCTREINHINRLFDSIRPAYSQEEISAGVRELNFGFFGMLDWYARRMGIQDQNEVSDVSWSRIWQCMKNDNDLDIYQRRLQKQYMRKKK